MHRTIRRAATALLCCALAGPVDAQPALRPAQDWVTLETTHFRFHTPREHLAWTQRVAARMESVREAVRGAVGFAPPDRVDIIIDDPSNDANGSAWSQLGAPTIVLYPVPPGPRSGIGHSRSWGELLAVHEFAHIAHLSRPSRAPANGLRRLLPAERGPVWRKAPRWITEGYATYIEGVLSGTGRPHAAGVAAELRLRALSGTLPTYGILPTGGWAYTQGAAFQEWLGGTAGDSSLTALWRRMSARTDRSFDAAFRGVYGESPATLYQRFTAEQTIAAGALRDAVDAAGRVEGVPVHRAGGQLGDPAVSPDGRRLAITTGGPAGPRLLVLGLDSLSERAQRRDSTAQAERQRLLAKDPEDVPDRRDSVPGLRTVRGLLPVAGRAHRDPRWFRDGLRLLVTRSEPTADGALRPDLFSWDHVHGTLTRLTHGAGVRQGDPHPDGASAVATRCSVGRCDLVRVTFAGEQVADLVPPDPGAVWDRPRWFPDGQRVAAAVQRDARWRIAVVDARTGDVRVVSPDDGAERYDPEVVEEGRALVYVSELGGIPNLVRLDLRTGVERGLTRVLGSAVAASAVPRGDTLYFLHRTALGVDLHRLDGTDTLAVPTLEARGPRVPLARRPEDAVQASVRARGPFVVDTFTVGPVGEARPYGLGPQRHRVLPLGDAALDASAVGLALHGTDPLGRFRWLGSAQLATHRGWQGASLTAQYLGWPMHVTGGLFVAQQDLGANVDAIRAPVAPAGLDAAVRLSAATLGADLERPLPASALAHALPFLAQRAEGSVAARGGLMIGHLQQSADGMPDGLRAVAHAEVGARLGLGRPQLRQSLGLVVHAAQGRTAGQAWGRQVLRLDARWRGLEVDALWGGVSREAPVFERFVVGGTMPSAAAGGALSQRLMLPALPQAALTGRFATVLRAALPVGPVTPYVTSAGAGDRRAAPLRTLAGLEVALDESAAPLLRLPALSVRLGAAQGLDGPFAGRTFGYAGVRFGF